jgi:toxin FitB
MIILDTNVISEVLRPQVDRLVDGWLNKQHIETLFATSINLAEILAGIEIMPTGKRQSEILIGSNKIITALFSPRVLAFDLEAAKAYSLLIARSRSNGISISIPDGQIAAIALVHGFKVATRDVLPFEAAGVEVINPWKG